MRCGEGDLGTGDRRTAAGREGGAGGIGDAGVEAETGEGAGETAHDGLGPGRGGGAEGRGRGIGEEIEEGTAREERIERGEEEM